MNELQEWSRFLARNELDSKNAHAERLVAGMTTPDDGVTPARMPGRMGIFAKRIA